MILVGLTLVAGACSPVASVAPPADELSGEDLFVSCAEIFKPGRTIDGKLAVTACHDLDGKARTPQYIRCTDGRHLWRIDATLSENPGWGFTGNVFTASGDLENDPDLADAMIKCRR
ncbi:hypothetical protein [Catenuloplanes atrovinosus]|uniref:Uncharacterized protein n=1 Tax=Catenuloplanes atrovinosus TaxID=137266 RepID=A0AAE3YP62_9ACTN|nr:hypothetical protein [Catenuloplanes atrovinosus]MDR7276092.1 hypothetical protein [Catenuloplanes atrovinosus]